jgi:diacylglycerol kinase family enzyme
MEHVRAAIVIGGDGTLRTVASRLYRDQLPEEVGRRQKAEGSRDNPVGSAPRGGNKDEGGRMKDEKRP